MPATFATTNAICSDPIGGFLTAQDGIVYYLTDCCGASGKGSVNSPTGVCCRKCYREVDAVFGMGWLVSDDAAWAHYADLLRPHLEQFTDKVVASTRRAAESR